MYRVAHLHLDCYEGIWATVNGYNIIEQKEIYIQIQPKDIIIMEFTGLLDKNGVKIFEGDIINPGLREIRFGDFISLSDDENKTPYSQGNGFYTISHSGEFFKMPFSFCHRQSENCEVIGNIYQHPELVP